MHSRYKTSKILIFTDLDGCLLDHYNYSYQPAAALLRKLDFLDIPVIPATSKTLSELLHLRKELKNSCPFIIENGAAVYIPNGYFPKQPADCIEDGGFWIKKFTFPRDYWLSLIGRSGIEKDNFKSFSASSTKEIAAMTGLDYEEAERASQRQYGEPVAWRGGDKKRKQFIKELTQLGAKVLQGGRFLHVSGDCDKGSAMKWLTECYAKALNKPIISVAIGDSGNDIAMLEQADISIVISSPEHSIPKLNKSENVYISSKQGPEGWAESVSKVLDHIN